MVKKILIAVVAVVVLAGGGVAAVLLWPRPASAEAVEKEKPVEKGIVAFDPFVANLADANASRFLRVSVQLVVSNPKVAEKLEKTSVATVQARAAILDVLMTQTSDALATADGKTALKKAIAERTAPLFEDMKVLDVLFTDFVIQY